MSKRITPEETIVNYFMASGTTAEKAEWMFNVIRGIMKTRGIMGRKATNPTVGAKKGKRVDKATEFNTQELAQ